MRAPFALFADHQLDSYRIQWNFGGAGKHGRLYRECEGCERGAAAANELFVAAFDGHVHRNHLSRTAARFQHDR